MTLRVFHEPGMIEPGARLGLSPDESHYLVRVRRAQPGSAIEVLDGVAGLWHATVADADPGSVSIEVGSPITVDPPRLELDVLIGLPEPAVALDSIARCCELGAATVVLVGCERSQGRQPTVERIGRVIRSAQRQCGRPIPVRVEGPRGLDDALSRNGVGFVAARGVTGDGPRAPSIPHAARVSLLIGPEGGLTDAELTRARAAGFSTLDLGPWTLRTGTAVVAGVAVLMGADHVA